MVAIRNDDRSGPSAASRIDQKTVVPGMGDKPFAGGGIGRYYCDDPGC